MRPFPPSFGNLYILLTVNYVSKLVEVIACPRNDANIVVRFIQRNILSGYGDLRTIISDEGSHFAYKLFATPEQIWSQTCYGIYLSLSFK